MRQQNPVYLSGIVIFLLLLTTCAMAEDRGRAGLDAVQKRRMAIRALRITAIAAYDQGDFSESASQDMTLDTVQSLCGDEEDQTDEPFFDTLVALSVTNDTSQAVRFHSIHYVVKKGKSNGRRYRAPRMAPIGTQEVLAGSQARLTGLFLDTDDGRKYYAGYSQAIDEELGFRNVRFVVRGRDFSGKPFRIRARTAFSFGVVDRCE